MARANPLETATLMLATELSPWSSVLQLCRARYRVRRSQDGETVALVDLDLHRLLHNHGESDGDTLMRSLREALELVRLALAIDGRVLEALAEMRALFDEDELWGRRDDDAFCHAGLVDPSDVTFVAHYERFTTNVLYDAVVSHWTPRGSAEGSLAFELKRDRLRAKLQGNDEQLQRTARPMRMAFHVLPSVSGMFEPVSLVEAHREFFVGLTNVALYAHTIQAGISPRGAPLNGKTMADLDVTGFRANLGFIQPTKPLLPSIRKIATVPDGFLQSGYLSLGVRDIKCAPDGLAEYLTLVLRHSPDAAVRVVSDSVLRPLSQSRRTTGWAKETQTVFHALQACGPIINNVCTDLVHPVGTSHEDQVLFWTAFMDTFIATSRTCFTPIRSITADAARRTGEVSAVAAIRQVAETFHGEKRQVERLIVQNSRMAVLDDAVDFMRLIGPVKTLVLDAFDQMTDLATLEPILDLSPTLENLSVCSISLVSLDFILQRYGAVGRLESLCFEDLVLQDPSSVMTFFDRLSDVTFPLSQRLHTLRLHQERMEHSLVLDEAMVDALERLLRINRYLRDVCVVVQSDVCVSSRGALLSHDGDLVVPPTHKRRRDITERVAFMSVVAQATNRAINILDALQLRLIFGFSATRWTRSVRIVDSVQGL